MEDGPAHKGKDMADVKENALNRAIADEEKNNIQMTHLIYFDDFNFFLLFDEAHIHWES